LKHVQEKKIGEKQCGSITGDQRGSTEVKRIIDVSWWIEPGKGRDLGPGRMVQEEGKKDTRGRRTVS